MLRTPRGGSSTRWKTKNLLLKRFINQFPAQVKNNVCHLAL
jgi:hypothetical protein